MKFKQNHRIIFLDPLFEGEIEYDKKSKIDIILSPSLYWVKKVKLPVTTVREVKKLLESIFEDSLPEGNYSYSAYKVEDEFLLFAYEDKKILQLLSQKGIALSSVSSIHFAQSEFDTIESAIKINDDEAIYLKEGVVVITPLSWVKNYEVLDLEDKTLSKHTIKLQQFGHIVDNKSLYKIGIVGVIFAFILIAEIFITTTKTEAILEAKDEIFANYKLQPTMMQNRSTKSKYNSIHKIQTKLRKYIAYFLNMKLQTGQKITLIEYKNKLLNVTFEGVTKINQKNILKQLDAKKVEYKTSLKEGRMKVEIKL